MPPGVVAGSDTDELSRPAASFSSECITRERHAGQLPENVATPWCSRIIRLLRRLTMQTAMHHLSISAVRAEALFVSALQRSEEPSTDQVRQAVTAAVRALGSRGCAERVAQEFGDHPETAAARMRWACTVTRAAFAAGPAPAGGRLSGRSPGQARPLSQARPRPAPCHAVRGRARLAPAGAFASGGQREDAAHPSRHPARHRTRLLLLPALPDRAQEAGSPPAVGGGRLGGLQPPSLPRQPAQPG